MTDLNIIGAFTYNRLRNLSFTHALHSAKLHATHTLRSHGVWRKCAVAEGIPPQ